MSSLGPFATQRKSRWVSKMLTGIDSGFGHEDLSWANRAMLAIDGLDLAGQEVTANYLRDHLAPVVGFPPHKSHLGTLIRRGTETGLLRRTGRKVRIDGNVACSGYVIAGRAEVDRSNRLVVLPREEK